MLWGTQTAAYYVGHTAEATVVDANASDYIGIPSDDSTPDSGARGVFTDDQGQPHTIFLRHAATLGQRAAISYLPCLPGLAVERADFERSSVIYFGFVALSGGILLLYLHFVLRHLLSLRDVVKTSSVKHDA